MSKSCIGLFDRGGIPSDTQNGTSGYRAALGGFVVNGVHSPQGALTWGEFYTATQSLGSPVGSATPGNGGVSGAGTDAIDAAFNAIATYNLAQSGSKIGGPWTAKIRVLEGIHQPPQLAAALSQGTVTGPASETLTPWWTSAYRAARVQFYTKLAAYVPADGLGYTLDTHPNLGEVDTTPGPTYAEPMLLSSQTKGSPWTLAQLGATATQLETALYNFFDDNISIWTHTPVAVAHNPSAYGGEAFTEAFMTYFVSAASQPTRPSSLCCIGNDSLRANAASGSTTIGVHGPFTGNDPNTGARWYVLDTNYSDGHGGGYTPMYSKFASYGAGQMTLDLGYTRVATPNPITIQTDTWNVNGSSVTIYEDTLSYAVRLGARMVELAGGYNAISPAALAVYGPLLAANDPSTTTAGQIVQDVQGSTTAAATSLVVNNVATVSGNLLVLLVGARAGSTPTISVSGGGTWNSRFSQNTGANNGNLSAWDLTPGGSVTTITISSTQSGSIEYQFYEVSGGYTFGAKANTSGSSTTPSESISPAQANALLFGANLWPTDASVMIGSLPGVPWTNETTEVGQG